MYFSKCTVKLLYIYEEWKSYAAQFKILIHMQTKNQRILLELGQWKSNSVWWGLEPDLKTSDSYTSLKYVPNQENDTRRKNR